MSDPGAPGNNLSWRVRELERRLDKLESGDPSVVAERVGVVSLRLSELKVEFSSDLNELRDEMRSRDDARRRQIQGFQRIFVSVFTGVGIATAVAVIAQLMSQGQFG